MGLLCALPHLPDPLCFPGLYHRSGDQHYAPPHQEVLLHLPWQFRIFALTPLAWPAHAAPEPFQAELPLAPPAYPDYGCGACGQEAAASLV
jgi:hypothetical protein